MPKGLLIRLGDGIAFPSSFPSMLRDPMDAPGVLLIHDYANADCLPDGTPVPQGQAIPTYAYNLARRAGAWPHHTAGADGQFIAPAGLITYPSAKGVKFSRNNGNTQTNYESLTGTGNFAATLSTHNFLFIAWLRMGIAMQNMHILGSGNNQDGDATNPGLASFSITLTEKNQSGGADFPGSVWLRKQDGVQIQTGFRDVAKGIVVGELIQLAFALEYGPVNSTLHTYRNGAFLRSVTQTGMTALYTNNLPIKAGASGTSQQGDGTVHRILVEDLVVSGRDRLAVVQQDYALNAGRFG